MQDLALIVSLMLLAELLLGLAALVFAIFYRAKRKFRTTTLVLIAVLAAVSVWMYANSAAMAVIPASALAVAALLRFIPLKAK